MKFTTKLLLFWTSIFLAFLIGIMLVMSLFEDVHFNYIQISIAFFINGVVPPIIYISFFYKKLNYMESKDETPPNFDGVKTIQFPYKTNKKHPFNQVMQKIDRQYIISYSNRKAKILKFRTDSRMHSWGSGGYIRMTDDNILEVFVYPIYQNSRREKLILNQTLRIIYSLFH